MSAGCQQTSPPLGVRVSESRRQRGVVGTRRLGVAGSVRRPKATEGWPRRGKRWSMVNPRRPHLADGKATCVRTASAARSRCRRAPERVAPPGDRPAPAGCSRACGLGGAGYPARPGTASGQVTRRRLPEVRAPYPRSARSPDEVPVRHGPAQRTQTRSIPAQIAGVGFTFPAPGAGRCLRTRDVPGTSGSRPRRTGRLVRVTPASWEASPSALPVAAV
jgi:hypothetical protein